jgi:development and cellular proliferation protein Cullin-7
MAQTAFTRAQAQAKVGTRVRTRVAFAGVPEGAVGTIISADRVVDGYDVQVAWGGSGRRTPWVDWLTKGEYEARLIEMP